MLPAAPGARTRAARFARGVGGGVGRVVLVLCAGADGVRAHAAARWREAGGIGGVGGWQGAGVEELVGVFDVLRRAHEGMAPEEFNDDATYKTRINQARRSTPHHHASTPHTHISPAVATPNPPIPQQQRRQGGHARGETARVMVERGRGVAGRQGLDLKHGLTVKQSLLIQLSCATPAPASPPPPTSHRPTIFARRRSRSRAAVAARHGDMRPCGYAAPRALLTRMEPADSDGPF